MSTSDPRYYGARREWIINAGWSNISILHSLDETKMFHVKHSWDQFHESQQVFKELEKIGKYAFADVDFTNGVFEPQDWGWTGGPDNFELGIRNKAF